VYSTTSALENPRGAEVLAAVADAIVRLYGASLAVQARIDTDAILTAVTSTISDLIPATCMAVLMKADPDTSRVVFADHSNPAMVRYLDEYVTALLRPGVAPTTGISQRVIESGSPRFMSKISVGRLRSMLSEFGQNYTLEHRLPIAAETISALVVPMRSGPAIVGSLAITDWTGGEVVTEADVEWMQRVADRVGLTIDNAQLRNKAIDRVDRIRALTDVALAIVSSQDLRLTLKLIVERVTAMAGVDAADVLLLDDSDNTVFIAASAGFHIALTPDFRFPVPPGTSPRSLFERAVGAPAPVDWLGQHRRSFVAREGLKIYTAIPLTIGEMVVGALELFSRTVHEPDPEWLSFLDAMASHAAIAVDNANMHEELRRVDRTQVGSRVPPPMLSEREREILTLVVEGASNRDIADKLHLSQNTIKFHVRQLLEKAGVVNRTELASRAVQRRWL
jgi:DNA-binding CsgD family transcriptional regulator